MVTRAISRSRSRDPLCPMLNPLRVGAFSDAATSLDRDICGWATNLIGIENEESRGSSGSYQCVGRFITPTAAELAGIYTALCDIKTQYENFILDGGVPVVNGIEILVYCDNTEANDLAQLCTDPQELREWYGLHGAWHLRPFGDILTHKIGELRNRPNLCENIFFLRPNRGRRSRRIRAVDDRAAEAMRMRRPTTHMELQIAFHNSEKILRRARPCVRDYALRYM